MSTTRRLPAASEVHRENSDELLCSKKAERIRPLDNVRPIELLPGLTFEVPCVGLGVGVCPAQSSNVCMLDSARSSCRAMSAFDVADERSCGGPAHAQRGLHWRAASTATRLARAASESNGR